MPAKRSVPIVVCPDHRGSTVQGWGKRSVSGVLYQRYRCRAASKSGGTHYLLAPVGGGEILILRPAWTRPPRCAKHPTGRVTRHGPYGEKKAGRIRQRYLCEPGCPDHPIPCPADCANESRCRTHRTKPCSPTCRAAHHCSEHPERCPKTCPRRPHAFTPPLPRRWIEGHGFEDACEHCEQPRSVHHGEQNAARHHSFTSLTVAAGIIRMSGGDTYSETGQWALRQRKGKVAKRASGSAPRKPASRARANNAWHIAADWVETFAPVLYNPLDAELRAKAMAERARLDAEIRAGGPLTKPIIWVADEMVIGKTGRTQAFVVLLVAVVEWPEDDGEPIVRLRLARALPDKSLTAWLVAFHELAGPENAWPDFLVCDYSKALIGAAHARLGPQVRWVPSLWHLTRSIRAAFWGRKPGDDAPATPAPVERHLATLTRGSDPLSSPEGWAEWWRILGDLFVSEGRSRTPVENRRKIWGPPYAAAIPDLVGTWGPLSNAAIESIQRTRLRRMFESRDHAMTSAERTNSLLDLVVAREHGRLDNDADVARRLREDAHANGGWMSPPRSINDPANPNDPKDRYKSLRDRSLTQRLVFERGIA